MPTLLAIAPHPDDESYSFGGTIALAAKAGWACHILALTSGEKGKRHDGPPASPATTGPAREAELASSAAALGAAHPDFWRLSDGGLATQPSQSARLVEYCRTLQPDAVLSLGSDGAYGHPDHVTAFRWTLEAIASLPSPRPALLLATFPTSLFLPQYEKCIGMMGEPPNPPASAIGSATHDLALDISTVADQKLASIAAHRSQLPGADPHALFPPGIIAALLQRERFTLAFPADPLSPTLAALVRP
jgi:LmbE family N-acetylglucosaminyl deacetylase